MNNLETTSDLLQQVKKSAGNSENKYGQVFGDSLDVKVKDFKHAWEELYRTLISSDALKAIVQTGTKLIGVLDTIVNSSKGVKLSFLVLLPIILHMVKNFKLLMLTIMSGEKIKLVDVIFGDLFGRMSSGITIVDRLKSSFKVLKLALSSLLTTPQGLMFLAVATAIGVATAAVIKHANHQKKLREENDKLKQSYDDLKAAMASNDKEGIKNASENPQKAQSELQELIKKRAKLNKEMESAPTMREGATIHINSQFKETEQRIKEITKALKDNGYTVDEITGKVKELTEASLRATNLDMIDTIKETGESEIKNKDSIVELGDEYFRLASIQNKNKEVNQKLTDVSNELNGKVKGLILTKDKEGNVTVQNTGLLAKEVEVLQTEGLTINKLTQVKLEAAKNSAQIQYGMTKYTYEQARRRMQILEEEANSLKKVNNIIDPNGGMAKITGIKNPFAKAYDFNRSEAVEIKSQIDAIDKIFNQAKASLDDLPDNNSVPNFVPNPDETKKSTDATRENTGETDKNREAVNKARESIKQYELSLKSLEMQMTKNNIALGRLYEHSDSYINKLKEKQSLIKQEIALNKQQIATNGKLANSLGAVGGSYASGMGNSIGEQVVRNAQQYLGRPYKWGGSSPAENFDCSGLVQYVYKQVGISLNRTTYDQVKQGTAVSKNQLQVGDAVFFGSPSAPHHVGIYMGNGKYIHSPKTGDVIKVSNLNSRSDYATARRYASGGSSVSRTTSSNYSGKYASYINEAANKYGVSAALIAAIIKAESDFNPNVRSGAGAMGLMQLMPETARELGVRSPYDPRQNIMGGTQEISKYLKKYNGNLDLALAAYNAGMGNVQKYGGVPPFKETKNYIPKVKKFMKEYGGSESSIHSTIDEQMDLIGKSMDLEKKNLELQEELNKINIQILEAKLGQFDDKVKSID
ncbi:transglycosylase SLT domain-containing protein [Clostridium sporogenes]